MQRTLKIYYWLKKPNSFRRRGLIMKSTSVMYQAVLSRLEWRNSSIFATKFVAMFVVLGILTYFLSQMGIVMHLAVMTAKNMLMIPIASIFGSGIIVLMMIFWMTTREARLVEKMVSNKEQIDFTKAQLPDCDNFAKSLFVGHFRKFSSAEHNHWSDEAKSSLEGYLEDMIFRGPRAIEFFENLLPILGLIGTALGIAEATLSKASGASMFVGVGNAIGTTVIALYCKLFLSTLNQMVFAERRTLLKTTLVIFRIAQKGGAHGTEK